MTAQRPYDVIVAGGGIIGTACASEFAQASLRVALIEPHAIAGGATGASMGHIAVMDHSEAQFVLTRYSQRLWQELSKRLPPNAEYTAQGALWIAANEAEMVEVHRKHRFYNEHGTPTEVLDTLSLAKAEPNLRPDLLGALWMKEDAIVASSSAARFLTEEAQQSGAQLFLGRKVIQIHDDGVVLEDGSYLLAGNVVLANGTAAGSLLPGIPIQPRKGHLLLTDRYPGFIHHQLIELAYLESAHAAHADSVAFNIQPRQTGQMLVGSSRQYGVEDPAVEDRMMTALLKRAYEYMPALRGLSTVRTWTGFRAATPDKLPLIGPYPGRKNVYLATGHEGLGISTSLATARLLADLLLNRESAIPREPYFPERIMRSV